MNKVYVDKARLLKRVIIISWITLALCFVVKIFGGNFFEIMCDNPNYKALCEYADNNFWCKYLLAFATSIVAQSFYELSIMEKYKFNKKEFIITLISVLLSCYFKLLNASIGLIFDLWLLIILPIILLGKNYKQYWKAFLGLALNFAFQIISLLTKNISFGITDNSTFISLIYGIDIYIMCFLYYLYSNFIKESKNMGAFWTLFLGKPVDKLKEMKVKREQQIEKLNEEIKAIETEIAKQSDKK